MERLLIYWLPDDNSPAVSIKNLKRTDTGLKAEKALPADALSPADCIRFLNKLRIEFPEQNFDIEPL